MNASISAITATVAIRSRPPLHYCDLAGIVTNQLAFNKYYTWPHSACSVVSLPRPLQQWTVVEGGKRPMMMMMMLVIGLVVVGNLTSAHCWHWWSWWYLLSSVSYCSSHSTVSQKWRSSQRWPVALVVIVVVGLVLLPAVQWA